MALTERIAKCADCRRTAPSSPDLPFFEDKSEGSAWALRRCAVCRYSPIAHARWEGTHPGDPKVGWPRNIAPHAFRPSLEGEELDGYYCGCRGWD